MTPETIKSNDGGYAFPFSPAVDADGGYPAGSYAPDPGMSMRDWFAGQALAGLLGRSYDHERGTARGSVGAVVDDAFTIADAMLAARKIGGAA